MENALEQGIVNDNDTQVFGTLWFYQHASVPMAQSFHQWRHGLDLTAVLSCAQDDVRVRCAVAQTCAGRLRILPYGERWSLAHEFVQLHQRSATLALLLLERERQKCPASGHALHESNGALGLSEPS
jgi:hypothetical protein